MALVKQEFVPTASKLHGVTFTIVFHCSALLSLDDAVNGLNKLFKRNRSTRLSRVEEFTDLHDFIFRKSVAVFPEELLEFLGINPRTRWGKTRELC